MIETIGTVLLVVATLAIGVLVGTALLILVVACLRWFGLLWLGLVRWLTRALGIG